MSPRQRAGECSLKPGLSGRVMLAVAVAGAGYSLLTGLRARVLGGIIRAFCWVEGRWERRDRMFRFVAVSAASRKRNTS